MRLSYCPIEIQDRVNDRPLWEEGRSVEARLPLYGMLYDASKLGVAGVNERGLASPIFVAEVPRNGHRYWKRVSPYMGRGNTWIVLSSFSSHFLRPVFLWAGVSLMRMQMKRRKGDPSKVVRL